VAYLSDPGGSVVFAMAGSSDLRVLQQGDGLAGFLACAHCDRLLAVRWRQYAAVNARAIEQGDQLGADLPVSPKVLPAQEKIRRWESLWFPRITIGSRLPEPGVSLSPAKAPG